MYFMRFDNFEFELIINSKNKNMSDRSYRDALGFYPTSNGDGCEMDIFIRIKERAFSFLKSRDIHSGNARVRMQDLYGFVWEETPQVFAYARSSPALARLLPSNEAAHSYIYSILFSLIAEDSRRYEESKRGNKNLPPAFHKKVGKPNPKRQRKEEIVDI
jgi:hypothetical protein